MEVAIKYLSTSQVVILVANKADLVRNREIKTNTAKQLAVKYGVKYIETSPGIEISTSHVLLTIILGINHNIDELLVGIFTQINLRQKKPSSGHSLNKVKLFIYITKFLTGNSRLVIFWEIYSEIEEEILENLVVI